MARGFFDEYAVSAGWFGLDAFGSSWFDDTLLDEVTSGAHGTASIVEAGDTSSSAGSVAIAASSTRTEAPDTSSAAGSVAIVAASAFGGVRHSGFGREGGIAGLWPYPTEFLVLPV